MAPFLFTGMEPGGFPDDGQSLTGSDSTAMCCCTEFPNSVSGSDQENRLLAGMLCKYRALSRMQFAFPDICGSSELRETVCLAIPEPADDVSVAWPVGCAPS